MEKFEKQESKTIIPLITPLLTINSSTIYALIPGVSAQKDVLHTVILCPESLSHTVQFTNHGILLNISI